MQLVWSAYICKTGEKKEKGLNYKQKEHNRATEDKAGF